MRHARWLWGCTVAAILIVAGCGEPQPMPMDDAGPEGGLGDGGRDGGNDAGSCAGRMLCSMAGARCVGNALVTCAPDADGCMVETRTDCGASGDVCDDSSGTAACVDPCTLIPETDRCSSEARACDGDVLDVCAPDANGCLVRTRTDCAAMPGGVCDASTGMAICALPPDPCERIPAADRCAAEGTSCEGSTLVECEPDAFGCLVQTRTDCASRAGGMCTTSGGVAACGMFSGDPCTGITQCTTPGAACEGPELVECERDAFGCFVETRTDCTSVMFGFCAEDPAGPDQCSTAAADPCMGVAECGMTTSRECTDRTTLRVCAPNAFGCFVETTTDCSASAQVCDATGGAARCVDPCSLVTVCPAATYCDGAELVTCGPNADGCLVERSRAPCPGGLRCDASGGAAMCIDPICPEVGTRTLDCTSGTVIGDTSMGSMVRSSYAGCTGLTSYDRSEQFFRFRNARAARVTITSRLPGGSTEDFDLFVLDPADGSRTCADPMMSCVAGSTGATGAETVTFDVLPDQTRYVVYDRFGTSGPDTSAFELEIRCVEPTCGDGTIEAFETCDDGNVTGGDGCSASCRVEPGWGCSGTPSTCRMLPPHSACTGAVRVASDTVRMGEDLNDGGARPTGPGCGTFSGAHALYYEVTIPPGREVQVDVTPTGSTAWDPVVLTLDSCSAAGCLARTNASGAGASERITISNPGSSPLTRIVVVTNFSASARGTYNIAFNFRTIPFTVIPLACVDLSAAPPLALTDGTDDGRTATLSLPFAFTFFGTAVTHWGASTNGFLQLFTSGTPTASTALDNATIPTAAPPNGMIAAFWDDLVLDRPGAGIRQLVTGTPGSRTMIVEWANARYFGAPAGVSFTFQAHLREGSNEIELHYCSGTPATDGRVNGNSATIGVENAAGTRGIQYSHNMASVTWGTTALRFPPVGP